MPVLCDTQIRELIGIEPFEDGGKRPGKVSYGVSSYGYDVRVGSRFKIFTATPRSGGVAIVDPKNFTDDLFVEVDAERFLRLARAAVAPEELPVGVVTAVLGGGYLFLLIRRRALG